MSYYQELLIAWRLRAGPGELKQFSEEARQRVATLFLEMAGLSDGQQIKGSENTDLHESSMELVALGIEDALPVPVFSAELRNCQLSLVDIFTSSALENKQQRSAGDDPGTLQFLVTLLASLDGLISQSAEKFMESGDTRKGSTSVTGNTGGQGKTLQHEIRTPLQGALLTTELMLEDAGQGDPVSADDILAVRKSIETAVGILNDFASRSSTD